MMMIILNLLMIFLQPSSYHNYEVECKIIKDISNEYNYGQKDSLNFFISLVNNDTIILISRYNQPLDNNIKIDSIKEGFIYKIKLQFISNYEIFRDGKDNYLFEPDSVTYILGCSYYRHSIFVLLVDKYIIYDKNNNLKEQEYNRQFSDKTYLFYTSPDIIGKYIIINEKE